MKNDQKATYTQYAESAAYLRAKLPDIPKIAIILGSGLGGFADQMTQTVTIPYEEIPHFPVSTVSYQKGEFVYGLIGDTPILAMNGRFHYYEGWEMWQTAYPIGVFRLLGISQVIITNAAGGISPAYMPGSLVLVRDQIKLSPDSPLRGANLPQFGERFFDMQHVYDARLANIAMEEAAKLHIPLQDHGVYAYMSGPQYETPAEIKMLGILGATLVGMSTVAEVIAAAHCGLPVVCISCVSNYAAGITGEAITSEEVLETGARMAKDFTALVTALITRLGKENGACV